jgi:hypothetical protein
LAFEKKKFLLSSSFFFLSINLKIAQIDSNEYSAEIGTDRSTFMPELFEKVEETTIDIRNIQGYVREVRRLQGLILSSTSADNSLAKSILARFISST